MPLALLVAGGEPALGAPAPIAKGRGGARPANARPDRDSASFRAADRLVPVCSHAEGHCSFPSAAKRRERLFTSCRLGQGAANRADAIHSKDMRHAPHGHPGSGAMREVDYLRIRHQPLQFRPERLIFPKCP